MKIVDVTITSDLICPWCWIGLKKLQEASKTVGVEARIAWRPYLLRPNAPEEGLPKGGDPSSRVSLRLREAGESAGIDFTGLTDRTPNTALFHATMKMLQEAGGRISRHDVTMYHEEVFADYFTRGVFPNEDNLLKAAKRLEGRNPQLYRLVRDLYDESGRDHLSRLRREVGEEAAEASRHGISGVPSFAFGKETVEPAFSGAQPVSVFARFLLHYAEEYPKAAEG